MTFPKLTQTLLYFSLVLLTGLALLAQPALSQECDTVHSYVKQNGFYIGEYVPYRGMGGPQPADPPPPDRLDIIKELADFHYPLIVKAKVLSVRTQLSDGGCSIETVLEANRIQTIKGEETPQHLSIHIVGGKYKFPEGWATIRAAQWAEPFPASGQTWIFFLLGRGVVPLGPDADLTNRINKSLTDVSVSQKLDEAHGAWRVSNGQIYSVLNPEFGPAAELWNGAAEAEFVTEVTRLCGK